MSMKPEIKTEWVRRLRSGEIEQGRGVLRDKDDKMCCLGVLTEMAVEAGVTTRDSGDSAPYVDCYSYDSGIRSYPPAAVVEWAGLRNENPMLPDYAVVNGEKHLANINDAGSSFSDIADLIEAYL